jgi:hypothetical protein
MSHRPRNGRGHRPPSPISMTTKELFEAVAEVMATWEVWRERHDISSDQISCCPVTLRLWRALDTLHRVVTS